MIAKSLFFEIPSFKPNSSATKNTTANMNPPRPSFQLMLMVSGYAASANRVGLAMRIIPRRRFFCIKYANKNDQ